MRKTHCFLSFSLGLISLLFTFLAAGQDLLLNLSSPQNYKSKRISSFDRSGANKDAITIEPGKTAVLAEIKGPGAIHHIWVTIAAEAFYGRKIILRMYWDGEKNPSVETPLADFFGVGHGLDRNFSSLPINCSSEGRARNCYWYMPFRKSALITATNEGSKRVDAFYYYIDYRELKALPVSTPYFHAQYRQEMPCIPGQNYLILEATGRGHYVGCNLSVLQKSMGWWGEGDDMIYVDDEEFPSLHGTGSEDYFSDAWGMREDENPFYGCPLQEDDFQVGSKATVYRFHLPDPIPFLKSIRVEIEHGHANDRSDYYSSVAYWYQIEPHQEFLPLPSVKERLPYALEAPSNFIFPRWEEVKTETTSVFDDKQTGLRFVTKKATQLLTPYYSQSGKRYPAIITEKADAGMTADLFFPVEIGERYDIDLYFLKGPMMGDFQISGIRTGEVSGFFTSEIFRGYSPEKEIVALTLKDVLLQVGTNFFVIQVTGKDPRAGGMEIGFVGLSLTPSLRRFIREWNIIGPFDAPDMDYLQTAYPPESEIDLEKKYHGKGDMEVGWRIIQAEESGYVPLEELLKPNEQAIAYAFVYVFSPDQRPSKIMLGSDDGVRVWLNDILVHSNPAYRGASPDQDRIDVELKKGWNKLLVKVLQGSGGWGFYLRFVDPQEQLRFSSILEPPSLRLDDERKLKQDQL